MNIDNFVIAMRRDREAAHRARAAAAAKPRAAQVSARAVPAPVIVTGDR